MSKPITIITTIPAPTEELELKVMAIVNEALEKADDYDPQLGKIDGATPLLTMTTFGDPRALSIGEEINRLGLPFITSVIGEHSTQVSHTIMINGESFESVKDIHSTNAANSLEVLASSPSVEAFMDALKSAHTDVTENGNKNRLPTTENTEGLESIAVLSDDSTYMATGKVLFLNKNEAELLDGGTEPDDLDSKNTISVTTDELMAAWFELQAIKKGGIAIYIEGGIIQDIVTDTPAITELNVVTIDFDTEGADEDWVMEVANSSGGYDDAYVSHPTITYEDIDFTEFEDKSDAGGV